MGVNRFEVVLGVNRFEVLQQTAQLVDTVCKAFLDNDRWFLVQVYSEANGNELQQPIFLKLSHLDELQ